MNKTISSKRYFELVTWLKSARQHQGLSMRAMAQLLGEPHSFIQKVETLERKLDVYEYVQYCDVLKIDPSEGIKKYLQKNQT
ncbi:helix-turn-helix transcriptional regulator [Amphritea sp. 2_MG-2023]|uniref:helix-turn-helix domain-containing protein n=1 Tax=Amphritea TaxID=515417 RepID=UPI001C07780F|nr:MULTISPECIES: helix-turn-helix transcriptional regulator [Amphritea]MBU2967328.1 helix-turn-helix domain-containing protein [Amphritea atlantica]MDO6420476.1 helix-turn-helix transcriptional regulator [Amphritea sp. 2_MG-2023]